MMGTKPEPSTTSLHEKYSRYDEAIVIRALAAADATPAGAPLPLV